jgi:hypothetical protein
MGIIEKQAQSIATQVAFTRLSVAENSNGRLELCSKLAKDGVIDVDRCERKLSDLAKLSCQVRQFQKSGCSLDRALVKSAK